MYPKKWYISPKKWPFAQNKFSAQDILIYVVNFREWHLRTFLSSNPQGCHNWGVGRGSSQFWQCQYSESSNYSSPLTFPICVVQKSSVNQEAKLKQFESFSQKFIFSHYTKSSCRGNKDGKDKNAMKKTTRANKRFGVESLHRRHRDTKWAATLLTTQPSKAASSGCLACHSPRHSSCMSLITCLACHCPHRVWLLSSVTDRWLSLKQFARHFQSPHQATCLFSSHLPKL